MLLSDSQFYPDPVKMHFRRLGQHSLKMGVAVWHNIYNYKSKAGFQLNKKLTKIKT